MNRNKNMLILASAAVMSTRGCSGSDKPVSSYHEIPSASKAQSSIAESVMYIAANSVYISG